MRKLKVTDLMSRVGNFARNHKKFSILAGSLATLVATTAIKDNVHFGSATLNHPQENHYTWGIVPTTTVLGDAKGNFYTMGLIYGINEFEKNSELNGDASAYGLFGAANLFGNNSKITGDLTNKGALVRNSVSGWSLFANDVFGLKDYVVGKDDKEGGQK